MPRLYKKEKLCSKTAIDRLFAPHASGKGDNSALAFPLRCLWSSNPGRHCDAPIQFLISVPKRRLRHAVDRVTMRRRIREAYRLNRDSYPMPEGTRIDLVIVYIDSRLRPYHSVEKAMRSLLQRIQDSATTAEADTLQTSADGTTTPAENI